MLAPTKKRGKTTAKAGAVSAETATVTDLIQSLPIDKCHPHPLNPAERSTAEGVADLMPLIEQHGQDDPGTVRPHPEIIGHWQITSGHRRHACLRLLGRDTFRAIVEDMDDSRAAEKVALGNAGRKDLDPIQRAELLQYLITPVDEGGAGLDRLAAGAMFGLESESGVKNTLRLLKLPESIRKLIISGKLPIRAARALIPYAEATVILEDFAKDILQSEWEMQSFLEDPSSYDIAHADCWRPMDGETLYRESYAYELVVRKFEPTAKQRQQLQIVTLPVGEGGKAIEVAQNVKLFDQLNKPHLVKASGYGVEKRPKKPDPKSLTPAQQAAEAKRKAKEADKRLAERLPVWRMRFMRLLLARQTQPTNPAIACSLPWWIQQAGSDANAYIAAAIESLGCGMQKPRSTWQQYPDREVIVGLIAVADPTDTALPPGHVLLDRLWRLLVWPQRLSKSWTGEISNFASELYGDQPPAKLVRNPETWRGDRGEGDLLQPLFGFAGVSIECGWHAAAMEGAERQLLEEFLKLHTVDQLRKQAKAWGQEIAANCGTKASIIAQLLAAHERENPLPMPEVLAPPAAKPKAKRTKKAKGAKQ